MKYLALIGALAATAVPVHASTLTDRFSSFWVLGDSLSDNQNTARMVGALNAQATVPIPFPPGSPLQQPGVSSDGFTWAREFTEAFAAAGRPTANLSFGAARASNNGSGPPDLADQISASADFTTNFTFAPGVSLEGTVSKYPDGAGGLMDRQDEWGDDALVTVFIGGNDFLDAASAIGSGPAAFEAALGDAILGTFDAVTENIDALEEAGINDFLVMNLPDFSVIPQFNGPGAPIGNAVSGAARLYNTLLEDYLSTLRRRDVNVTSVDIFSALTDADRIDRFGLTEVDNACVSVVNPVTGNCDGFLFFDNIHPTAQGHRLVADLAVERLSDTYTLQPVPLPAPILMLITALGGTLLMRRRKNCA